MEIDFIDDFELKYGNMVDFSRIIVVSKAIVCGITVFDHNRLELDKWITVLI